jgi:hypothetical protein
MFPEPLSNSRIRKLVVESNNSAIAPGCGFKSLQDFKSRLALLPTKGGDWKQAFVQLADPGSSFVPPKVEFWKRNSLEVLKDIIADVRLAKEMKWAPEKHYNLKQQRVYSELWSGDWWWEKQVRSASRLPFDSRLSLDSCVLLTLLTVGGNPTSVSTEKE